MKVKGPRPPRKHSGSHNDILAFLIYCIGQGDDDYKKAAWRIHENEWMSPDSKTGSDYKSLEVDCKRTWDKALQQVEAGTSSQKRLKDYEKLRIARDWVDGRVRYDTFLGQYLVEDRETGPAAEYDAYNAQADDKTFIEKHYFQNAFEVDRMPRVSTIKEWAAKLPKWDKKDWIKKLCEFVPAKDKRQAELFIKGWLIRSYIQAVNPENLDYNSIVNRWFLILYQHRQESGKSGFFRWLSPVPEWVKENGLEDDKDGYIALARYLFVLDDELGVLSRATQLERIKSMISISKIDVRLPYGKADVRFARVASFCGSTNNEDIFPPSEGTTRFLILPLTEDAFAWEKYTKQIDKTKLWAQVKYLVGTTWLNNNVQEIIKYRTEINTGFVREDLENFAVTRYVVQDDSATVVMRAGDVMKILSDDSYGLKNLVLLRIGQALKRKFGERVNGYSIEGIRCKGYKIKVESSESGESRKSLKVTASQTKTHSPFNAKRRKGKSR